MLLSCGVVGLANGQAARRSSFERQVYRCFDAQDYERAAALIEEHLKQSPSDASMLYNLACARNQLGDVDAAASALLRAFKAGFDDIEHFRRDPDLASLREHAVYKTILEAADAAMAENARSAMDRWREAYGTEHYRYETDAKRRINYATALDETSHGEMRKMLEDEADHLAKTLFGELPGYYILIAVPTPADSHKFFNGDKSIGGMYQHSLRRLVSRDIGGSLRHEFFHAMHFGHMERLGQPHALWIQEGLASLYEDYEFSAEGTIRFLPNDRQLIVKSRARSGRLPKWEDLLGISAEAFMNRASQMYPTVRSIFEYVADQGKLQTWYKAYVEHFGEDRTGAKAFEIAFGKPVTEIERDWRRWIMDQPAINLRIRAGDAALGVRCDDDGSNDGVLVTDVLAGSAASQGGLRRGDVVVAIDDRSTRSLMDLRKIIASQEVGDEVEIRLRRDGEYITVKVTLRAAPAGV